ncbi:MAG: MBL fold metallo-hydrolase [Planctomycetota bacterium]|jgi:ribonuclease Z|nr:MBL fold metallo-hydrolase [Planctomycetota bacterium]
MLLRGFSKALFSTWFYLPEIRAVFDAGEGINYRMAGRLTKVDAVFLTHGHSDHFTGLLNLLIARTRLAPPEGSPPLDIYYPGADTNIGLYIDYMQRHLKANNFSKTARFHQVAPGEEHPLQISRKHYVRTFPVKHGDLPAVGYCVFEKQDKVKEQFADRSPRAVGQLIRDLGRESVLYTQNVPLVCYAGDSEHAVEAPCERPRLLIHESTFLTEEDRATADHATLAEAFAAARQMQPKELLLFHFSARYFPDEIRAAIENQQQTNPLDCEVHYVLPGKMIVMSNE